MLFSKYENGDSESSTTIKKHKIKEYFCKNGVFLSTTWSIVLAGKTPY